MISVRAIGGRRTPSAPGPTAGRNPDPFSGGSEAGEVQGVPDRSLASGVIIDPDGYALTNAHAVVGAAHLRIRLASGREVSGRVLGYDLRTDIALLRLDTRGLPAARLGDPAELSVGDGVFAIGAPFGLERSVTAGIVSAKPRYLPGGGGLPMIQTDVAINPGSSGSPLFNLRGELVGINSMMMSSSGGYDGVSLALPIDVAMQVVGELRDHGYVRRSRLGARLQEVTPELARSFGLAQEGGAVILSVSRGGPADRAGLRTGDIILGLQGARDRSYPALQQAIAAATHQETLAIEVWRRGAIIQVALQPETIEREPEAEVSRPAARSPEPRLGLVVEDLVAAQRSAIASPRRRHRRARGERRIARGRTAGRRCDPGGQRRDDRERGGVRRRALRSASAAAHGPACPARRRSGLPRRAARLKGLAPAGRPPVAH